MDNGDSFEIINYISNENCTIKFKNGYTQQNIHYSNIKTKRVKNPFYPSVNGIGYLGEGIHSFKNKIINKNAYFSWKAILNRCYRDKDKFRFYKDVSICEYWHNFQNFAQWYDDNYKEHMKGWHLDKDILVKGNKVYGPETCCFVPAEINTLFINRKNDRGDFPVGVKKCRNGFTSFISKHNKRIYLGYFNDFKIAFNSYKTAKECYIKEVADLFKNSISEKVYNAMYEYKIEITD